MKHGRMLCVLLLSLMVMTGCGNGEPEKTEPAAVTQEVPTTTSLFNANAASNWQAPKDNTVNKDGDVLTISSTATAPPSAGTTGGAFVIIPALVAQQIANNNVKVTVVAKSAPGASGADEFAMAYSTAQVGNSEWRRFLPTEEFAEYSFTYTVPAPKNLADTNLDFIGIWADTSGQGKIVEIKSVRVEVNNNQ